MLLGGDTVTVAGSGCTATARCRSARHQPLDGTAATLISSDDDLTVIAGTVDVNALQADGQINVAASDGDVDIQSAEAGVLVQVAAFNGDIFVDTARGDDLGFAAQALVGDVLVNRATANGADGVVVVQAAGDATLRGAEGHPRHPGLCGRARGRRPSAPTTARRSSPTTTRSPPPIRARAAAADRFRTDCRSSPTTATPWST